MDTRKLILVLAAGIAALIGVATWAGTGSDDGPTDEPASRALEETVAQAPAGPVARITEEELAQGFVPLIGEWEDGGFHKHGWNHYGPGYFTLDHETGVLTAHGGMGLLWYAAETFGDFVLRLEFATSEPNANSGVFLRVPGMVTSDEYIYHSFEVQIHAMGDVPVHRTGAVYDAEPPSEDRSRPPGEWNEMEISFVGSRIAVSLNGGQVVDWEAEPRGKIIDFADAGYIGLQNHDWDTRVYFRNVRVRKLD